MTTLQPTKLINLKDRFMSKALDILNNVDASLSFVGVDLYTEEEVLAAMKEGMELAFEAGVERALYPNKPNKEQFINDLFDTAPKG